MNPSLALGAGKGTTMNPTTDPALRSWVPVAADSDFPIQNLPLGIFRRPGEPPRAGAAIGEHVLDLAILETHGFFNGPILRQHRVFGEPVLNAFLALGRPAWSEARATISRLLRADEPTLRDQPALRERALLTMRDVQILLPVRIGDYTDFYSSREHATNVGTMLRGAANALQPNWLHLPVAYHGRASSVVVSGTDLHRPLGQTKPESAPAPLFGPSRSVDFELEVGAVVGPGNELGQPIPITKALDHIFGLVLVNDWSARDIQGWEYVPLGPFLAKNFGTSVSPWIVSLEALEPFRTSGPAQDPEPLPYLRTSGPMTYDIQLEVLLQGEKMDRPQRICLSNFKHLYWNLAQQVAHHTINGCNLQPGDLLASGTISGLTPDSYGSMLELSWRGSKPLTLSGGEQRTFLQDGDRVTMRGWCQGQGYRVGFGEVTGRILAARPLVEQQAVGDGTARG
jgi:fumarylacetoacetase